jgi:hypothetical protein
MTTPTENVVAELRGRSAYPGDVNDQAAALIESQRATIKRVERERDESVRKLEQWLLRSEPWQRRVTALEAALKPFADFAQWTDAEGWTCNIHREGISVWFGPSDFWHAAQALSRSTEKNDD